MHIDKRICREKVSKNKNTAFLNGIIAISLFGVLTLPVTSLAFTPPDRQAGLPTAPTGQAGYDSYLLFTQQVGKTLAHSITAGVENTAQLYSSAWNEITLLAQQGPTFSLPKVGPLLASAQGSISSYLSFGNDMGEALAHNIVRYVSISNSLSSTPKCNTHGL